MHCHECGKLMELAGDSRQYQNGKVTEQKWHYKCLDHAAVFELTFMAEQTADNYDVQSLTLPAPCDPQRN